MHAHAAFMRTATKACVFLALITVITAAPNDSVRPKGSRTRNTSVTNATQSLNAAASDTTKLEPISFNPGPNGTIFTTANTSQEPSTLPGALAVPSWLSGMQTASGNTVAGNIQSWLSNIVLPLTTRIVGGATTPRRRYPYVASLRDGNGRHFCGGSLIHPRVVLTAGHCLDQVEDELRRPRVEIGRFYNTNPAETGYVSTRCQKTIVHEGWSFTNGKNDLALCILDTEVTSVRPVQVAQEFLTRKDVPLTVLGWGSTQEGGGNSEALQGVNVFLMDTAGCNVVYSNRISQGQQICAGLPLGGADACQGDSGGPLVRAGDSAATDLLVGIVSWGSGCGEANKPGVYTQVPAYITWINRQLQTEVGTTLAVPTITPDGGASSNVTDEGTPALSGSNNDSGASPDAGAGAGAEAADSAPATNTNGSGSSQSTTAAGSTNVVDTEDSSCACSWSRRSGGVNITEVGCRQHNMAQGDPDFFCYTLGGSNCSTAKVSNKYGKPSAWRQCNVFIDLNPDGNPPAPATATAEDVIVSSPSPPRVEASHGPAPTTSTTAAPFLGGGGILGGLFGQIASLFGR